MSDVQAELGNAPTEGQVESSGESTATEQQQEAPKAPDTSWVPKRISEITAARRAAEERAARAEAELAQFRAGAQTQHVETPQYGQQQQYQQPDMQQMERQISERMTLNSKIQAINEAGAKEFGDDFEKSVSNLRDIGVGGPEFLRVITAVPNAEKLVTWLGKAENLNEAMRVGTLDPVQMGIELTKMSTQAAKALSKQISKAPPPATTIDGGSGGGGGEPDPSDTAAWMKWRSSNRKSRR